MARDRDDGFTEFVVEVGPRLLRTAVLLTGDRHSGEDLVQTALARAYGKWATVRAADEPIAYVRRAMVNAHLSWLRRLSSTEQVVETVPDRGDGDDLQAAHAEADELRTALLRLSPRMRTAVVLRYFDDLSEEETARLMSCSRSTVNNHVTRGLASLRAQLTPARPPEPTPRRSS